MVKVVQASFINNDETMHHVDEVGWRLIKVWTAIIFTANL